MMATRQTSAAKLSLIGAKSALQRAGLAAGADALAGAIDAAAVHDGPLALADKARIEGEDGRFVISYWWEDGSLLLIFHAPELRAPLVATASLSDAAAMAKIHRINTLIEDDKTLFMLECHCRVLHRI
jgi:hypothetical protein